MKWITGEWHGANFFMKMKPDMVKEDDRMRIIVTRVQIQCSYTARLRDRRHAVNYLELIPTSQPEGRKKYFSNSPLGISVIRLYGMSLNTEESRDIGRFLSQRLTTVGISLYNFLTLATS